MYGAKDRVDCICRATLHTKSVQTSFHPSRHDGHWAYGTTYRCCRGSNVSFVSQTARGVGTKP